MPHSPSPIVPPIRDQISIKPHRRALPYWAPISSPQPSLFVVFYKRWELYVEACHALYEDSPEQTRYCVRWRSDLGLLVLKVTNDRKCLKFKTRSSAFLNRFELLNRSMLAKCQNRHRVEAVNPAFIVVNAEPMAAAASAAIASGGEGSPLASGGAKEEGKSKKKKGKKKK